MLKERDFKTIKIKIYKLCKYFYNKYYKNTEKQINKIKF